MYAGERDFDFNDSSDEDDDEDLFHQNLETYHYQLSLDNTSEEVFYFLNERNFFSRISVYLIII